MATQDKSTLKTYFETGDRPTQQEFTNLIDTVYNSPNMIFVYEKTDLPNAVSGVITLEGSKTYYFTTEVDLTGDRLVGGVNTCILGASSENCRIKSTGLTGTALITSVYSLPIRNIAIEADIALDLEGDTVTTALDWMGVNFIGCANVGTIKDYSNVIIKDSALINSQGLIFDGTIGTIGIEGSLITQASGTAISIPETAVVTRRFRINLSAFIVPTGSTGINVSASATMPVEGYILDTVNFSGDGSYLLGVNYDDNKSLFSNNKGITNTSEIGQFTVNGNTTPTVFLGADTPTKVLGATIPNIINQKFSHSDNRLTYTGALSRTFIITSICTMTGSANKEVGLYVAKNDLEIDESETYATTNSGGRFENISIQHIVELSEGDYVELWAENSTDGSSITFESMNFIIRSIG